MGFSRVRVLEIGTEGGGVELDADLDEQGTACAFFAWTGGSHGFEELFDETPEPRIARGPLSWADVLDTWLRPHAWLESYPQLIHRSIAHLVRRELPLASDEGRVRWTTTLG